MTNKLMYIASDDTQKYPFCRLKLVVIDLMSQPITKVPKVGKQTNKKTLL